MFRTRTISENLESAAIELEETIGTSPHSRPTLLQFLMTASERQKQLDIDKACEWLKHRGCLYIKYTEAGTGFDDERFIKDFRKAMEDEK